MSLAQGAKRGHDRGSKGGSSSDVRPYPNPDMHLLELTVISAQDLYPRFKEMKTYAVATVYEYPNEELITQTDTTGGTDPTWNDKFVMRVDGSFLRSDTSTIDVTIFAVRKWAFGNRSDHPLGQTRILVKTFLNPKARQMVALQIRRPRSLRPQGILNVSICLLGHSAIFAPSIHDHSGRRSVALSGITSRPNSMRFEMTQKIDEDIEQAISEQRRQMDFSGPLDKCQEQEQTERKALLSKIERYKSDLSPEHDKMIIKNTTEKIIKKNIEKWQRKSYSGATRFWLCGCRAFDDNDDSA
ncbi:uncharacterized protein LOC144547924 [Carex rostrata]